MVMGLGQLKELKLEACEDLKDVVSDFKDQWSPVFPRLSKVELKCLSKLKSIESLFSLSSSKNLEKLKLLRLCSCKELKEVIWGDKDENVSTIFPQMKCLVLKDLPKLVNFSQYNGTFDWPNLQTVRVSNVPSMKTFSTGNLNTPVLRSIDITFVKKLWLENLNETISFIHNNSGRNATACCFSLPIMTLLAMNSTYVID
ncbi:hypothetical protein VNO80_30265 [Phaseolus coccineus]|uniref:Uncharacterized protein n=1 Tax=Phaseolus coccineus TaxID=3886 RepID=A0AAN9LDL9_PHACN